MSAYSGLSYVKHLGSFTLFTNLKTNLVSIDEIVVNFFGYSVFRFFSVYNIHSELLWFHVNVSDLILLKINLKSFRVYFIRNLVIQRNTVRTYLWLQFDLNKFTVIYRAL